ncbi:MAG: late competence development ComFB family protein [Hormoscilla sp.]
MMKKKSVGANYRNAMEPLAAEEIDRQLERMPGDVVKLINKADAIAYALNRLPSLYSTTEEGWHWQQNRMREKSADLLAQAASRGIRAAQRKNKAFSTPLQQQSEAEAALQELKELLGRSDISWQNVVKVVEQAVRPKEWQKSGGSNPPDSQKLGDRQSVLAGK